MHNNTLMPTVFVMGAFDNLKTIDIRFLQESAVFGDVHVLLLSDEAYQKKFDQPPHFQEAERSYYLGSIRYVSHLTVIDEAFIDSIPYTGGAVANSSIQPVWAVRSQDAGPRKGAFCGDHGLQYRVIPDNVLEGFPIEEVSEKMRNHKKKKVMVSGCFDWVHSGHVRFFEEVSSYGDLYVVIGHDDNLRLLKGDSHPMFSEEERRYWVQSIRFVWKTLISSGDGWLDAEPEVKRFKPDIFVVNQDGDKPEKRQLFRELEIEYKVLQRKPKPGLPVRDSTVLRGSINA